MEEIGEKYGSRRSPLLYERNPLLMLSPLPHKRIVSTDAAVILKVMRVLNILLSLFTIAVGIVAIVAGYVTGVSTFFAMFYTMYVTSLSSRYRFTYVFL